MRTQKKKSNLKDWVDCLPKKQNSQLFNLEFYLSIGEMNGLNKNALNWLIVYFFMNQLQRTYITTISL